MVRSSLVSTLTVLLAGMIQAQEPLLWIEGESATQKKVFSNAWFDAVMKNELSGGDFISSFSEKGQPTGTAEYVIEVSQAGQYHFWVRANPRGTGLTYRLDQGEPVKINLSEANKKKGSESKIIQQVNVALDARPDARYLVWTDAGTLELTAGKHTLAFSLGGEEQDKRFGALDCFVLTTGEFKPNYQYKPSEKAPEMTEIKAGNSWAFDPKPDALDPAAILDLRNLNEKVAGEHGFIKLSPDGNSFVRGDGQPIRFWAGCEYGQREATKTGKMENLEHHAQFLAKRGINIVRLHGALQPKKEGSKVTDVDEQELDEAFRLVAAMKRAGIYTMLDPYWGSHTKLLKSWNLPDPGNDKCSALVFFDPTLQTGYKAWLKELYTRPNPYTGIPLKDDPAVAIIQFQNEDSMLFYTMQTVKGEQLTNLRKLFAEFLKKKYGSLDKAKEAWQGYESEVESEKCDWANGLPGLMMVWEFTRDAKAKKGGAKGREQRVSDQLEFMAYTMRKFNSDMAKYLREELGCKQLINAGNWRTVDQVVVDDAERWSYLANEVVGKNVYYTSFHRGINEGWQILPDQMYTSWSATKRPEFLPFNVKQPVGHPFVIPETLWVPPMLYQSEGPLMAAAQTALNGVDGVYWFCTGENWSKPMGIWNYSTPALLGQFPAAALIFRKGLVKEGEPAVVEERTPQNIWDRKTPIIAEEAAWDPNRDKGDMPVESSVKTVVDQWAFLVGPVQVKLDGDPSKSKVADLSQFIDKDKKTVRSITGETEFDIGQGLYRVNAPKAQGGTGFLGKAGMQKLTDVDITCGNDYATLVVVPLDDKPIKESGKVLVQAGTVIRPTGWKVRPARIQTSADAKQLSDGFRIMEVGKAPWQVENLDASVTIRNPGLSKATLLDANGMATDAKVDVQRGEGQITVKLPPHTMYVVLE